MKKIVICFIITFLFSGCDKDLVKKPDNLIDRKVMIDIMYDIMLLDVIKYQNPNSLVTNYINPKTYIYKKYKIDSLQLVKSNAYYAADYREYKKMFDELDNRLQKDKKKITSLLITQQKKETALKKKVSK